MKDDRSNQEIGLVLVQYDDTLRHLEGLIAKRDELASGLITVATALRNNQPVPRLDLIPPERTLADEIAELDNLLRSIEQARTQKANFEKHLIAAGRERFIRS